MNLNFKWLLTMTGLPEAMVPTWWISAEFLIGLPHNADKIPSVSLADQGGTLEDTYAHHAG
jgi:hypothetical protein